MLQSSTQRSCVLIALALLMALTRTHCFCLLPDASWAVFFLGGFWLQSWRRWAFPLLILEAGLIDLVVITRYTQGLWNHACISPAYGFLVVAYGALWLGGCWLARHATGLNMPTLGRTIFALLTSEASCYLVSNGSFYWIGKQVSVPRSFYVWLMNLTHWYLPFLGTTVLYVSLALLGALLGTHLSGTPASRHAVRQ